MISKVKGGWTKWRFRLYNGNDKMKLANSLWKSREYGDSMSFQEGLCIERIENEEYSLEVNMFIVVLFFYIVGWVVLPMRVYIYCSMMEMSLSIPIY